LTNHQHQRRLTHGRLLAVLLGDRDGPGWLSRNVLRTAAGALRLSTRIQRIGIASLINRFCSFSELLFRTNPIWSAVVPKMNGTLGQ
jgi:hypothetical protein